ncbi:unnamed protein product, partial [Staurois parvus]
TSLCCEDLHSVLITNRSLRKLDLSENPLQDSGIKRLCEGLQDPGCTLQDLRIVSLFWNIIVLSESLLGCFYKSDSDQIGDKTVCHSTRF